SFADARHVASGGIVVEPTLVEEFLAQPRTRDPLARLTEREREVLALIAEGRTDRGIGEQLFITPDSAHENRRVLGAPAHLRSSQRPDRALDGRRSGVGNAVRPSCDLWSEVGPSVAGRRAWGTEDLKPVLLGDGGEPRHVRVAFQRRWHDPFGGGL